MFPNVIDPPHILVHHQTHYTNKVHNMTYQPANPAKFFRRAALGLALAIAPGIASAFSGDFTIQQQSSGLYLDAHEGTKDNMVVTRPAQNNNTQVWTLQQLSAHVYTIRQKSNGRYLDAYEGEKDSTLVTRNNQNNATQRWVLTRWSEGGANAYRVQQLSTSRFMDAYAGEKDNRVVTRNFQENATQVWIIKKAPVITTPPPAPLNGLYFIKQNSSGMFLDAHQNEGKDWRIVTRAAQNNTTQMWRVVPMGGNVYSLRQQSSGRFADAHEGSRDNTMVTRNAQNNAIQQWILKRLPNGSYTVQQRSNGRYMDAYEGEKDNDVVTRNAQGNATQ